LNEPNTKVDCKTTTTCKEVVPKNIKIVYRDKVKIVYRDKIVYREKPIETEKEKIVYKDKIVYRDVYKSCAEQRAGKLDFDLIAGMGKNGFFTELDEENDEYTMRRAWGAVGGLRAAYRFDNSVTLGLGAISNETFFLTLGTSFFK
jgi:hypothetical protein